MRVKICGLKTPEMVEAAASAGAAYLGFVVFPKSPRHVEVADLPALALSAPEGVAKVLLTVNADDALLESILEHSPIDMLQLHGSESVDRVVEVREKFGLPVMKAVGVADEGDLPALNEYARVVDQLLVDAKPPKSADLPGGNGLSFDWKLIAGRRWAVPWMLAGGLTPENVSQAVNLTKAAQVDVSSGVETGVGVKDPAKIAAFIKAANEKPAPKLV